MKALHADPAFKAATSSRMKALHADPAFKAKQLAGIKGIPGVRVPQWVPRDLWDEYLETAAELGEEFAASHMRRLKREMLREAAQ